MKKTKVVHLDPRRGKTRREIIGNPNWINPLKGKTMQEITGNPDYVHPNKGRISPNKGRKLSDETKHKMSTAAKNRWKESYIYYNNKSGHPFYIGCGTATLKTGSSPRKKIGKIVADDLTLDEARKLEVKLLKAVELLEEYEIIT